MIVRMCLIMDKLTERERCRLTAVALLKKTIDPAQNIKNVMDLMVIMGIVLFLMETIMVSTGV